MVGVAASGGSESLARGRCTPKEHFGIFLLAHMVYHRIEIQ